MKHKKGFAAVLLTLIISALLSVSAFAASDGFSDVPEASPFYESVTYLAGQGITYGTGNGRYAPDTPITVRQWATMICRAFDKEDALSDPAGYGGDACINRMWARPTGDINGVTPVSFAAEQQFIQVSFDLIHGSLLKNPS